ncbi:MAG: DegV family protein [Butyricicoccus sp.]|nr:DegV family protein [Butyricicoccus sp.]
MASFFITTDNNGDLPLSYLHAHDVGLMSLSYMVDGQTYDTFHPMPVHEFYERMRDGAMPTTAQVNPENARAVFEDALRTHDEVLHLAFSSGLSGSYQSARIAADELMEEQPGKRIVVIDTLAASLGQGLLTHYAVQMRDRGCSLDETAAWVEENKLHCVNIFTVDDLFHLYRGGRVSKTTAVVGSMLNMKPILHVDDEGKLVAVGKVRGRKRSLEELVGRMASLVGRYENPVVCISHGDCPEDAAYVQQLVRERFGVQEFLVNEVGPSIGAHSGPGTVALFFLGDRR